MNDMPNQKINPQKVIAGILALLSSMVAVFMWVLKLKYKKQIGTGLLILITAISIAFWVWYANLPIWQDSDKSFNQIEQTFSTVTKGDLK